MAENTGHGSLHWSEEQEVVKSSRPLKVLCWLAKKLPFPVLVLFTLPVSLFYFIFSPRARTYTAQYQKQLAAFAPSCKTRPLSGLVQVFSFALCVVEKIAAWSGRMSLDTIAFHDDDVVELKEKLSAGKGAFLVGSHLGNMELLRCLATYQQTGVKKDVPVTAIMNMKSTAQFNKTLKELDPNSTLNVMNAADIGIDSVEDLQATLNAGGLVVIAADRTSSSVPGRNIAREFLGKQAAFPYGPFLLAYLLGVPVYYVFALRKKTFMFRPSYHMFVKKSSVERPSAPQGKKAYISALCDEFVALLQDYTAAYPSQWYNFYDFWADSAPR
ncbi:MAG TPA: hypothetical protein DDW78_00155 [Treponema sp.]|nr:hypothetical protein [Treponema sp.]